MSDKINNNYLKKIYDYVEDMFNRAGDIKRQIEPNKSDNYFFYYGKETAYNEVLALIEYIDNKLESK